MSINVSLPGSISSLVLSHLQHYPKVMLESACYYLIFNCILKTDQRRLWKVKRAIITSRFSSWVTWPILRDTLLMAISLCRFPEIYPAICKNKKVSAKMKSASLLRRYSVSPWHLFLSGKTFVSNILLQVTKA